MCLIVAVVKISLKLATNQLPHRWLFLVYGCACFPFWLVPYDLGISVLQMHQLHDQFCQLVVLQLASRRSHVLFANALLFEVMGFSTHRN